MNVQDFIFLGVSIVLAVRLFPLAGIALRHGSMVERYVAENNLARVVFFGGFILFVLFLLTIGSLFGVGNQIYEGSDSFYYGGRRLPKGMYNSWVAMVVFAIMSVPFGYLTYALSVAGLRGFRLRKKIR